MLLKCYNAVENVIIFRPNACIEETVLLHVTRGAKFPKKKGLSFHFIPFSWNSQITGILLSIHAVITGLSIYQAKYILSDIIWTSSFKENGGKVFCLIRMLVSVFCIVQLY